MTPRNPPHAEDVTPYEECPYSHEELRRMVGSVSLELRQAMEKRSRITRWPGARLTGPEVREIVDSVRADHEGSRRRAKVEFDRAAVAVCKVVALRDDLPLVVTHAGVRFRLASRRHPRVCQPQRIRVDGFTRPQASWAPKARTLAALYAFRRKAHDQLERAHDRFAGSWGDEHYRVCLRPIPPWMRQ